MNTQVLEGYQHVSSKGAGGERGPFKGDRPRYRLIQDELLVILGGRSAIYGRILDILVSPQEVDLARGPYSHKGAALDVLPWNATPVAAVEAAVHVVPKDVVFVVGDTNGSQPEADIIDVIVFNLRSLEKSPVIGVDMVDILLGPEKSGIHYFSPVDLQMTSRVKGQQVTRRARASLDIDWGLGPV